MRAALVVGVDYYAHGPALHGCVADARSVHALLAHNGDGSENFVVHPVSGTEEAPLSRRELMSRIEQLFGSEADLALFYFAGHGHVAATGGYLLASDATSGDDGIRLEDVARLANRSRIRNRIIVLDSCHSGIAGAQPTSPNVSELASGTTILTASTHDQYATERDHKGVFTALFVDALGGAAANPLGEITTGSVYAHIDKALPWYDGQRPVLMTNVRNFVPLRTVPSELSVTELRQITALFPSPGIPHALDPSYEPELRGRSPGMPAPDREKTRKFAILQKFNRFHLVVPVAAPHMWHAAMESKACKLTALGEHYRALVERNRI